MYLGLAFLHVHRAMHERAFVVLASNPRDTTEVEDLKNGDEVKRVGERKKPYRTADEYNRTTADGIAWWCYRATTTTAEYARPTYSHVCATERVQYKFEMRSPS